MLMISMEVEKLYYIFHKQQLVIGIISGLNFVIWA